MVHKVQMVKKVLLEQEHKEQMEIKDKKVKLVQVDHKVQMVQKVIQEQVHKVQ